MEEKVQNIYQCAVCLKEFSRKSTCKSHMKLHTGERPHECSTCGMTFASKSNLNTHALTHTYQKCNICGKTFTSKPLLKSHMIMHSNDRPHECDQCGRCFKRKGELRSHQVTHTGEKRWKCLVCESTFTERYSLKTHMRIHTGEKPFKCNVCEKTFARKSSYTSHSRMHTGIQPYKCFVCGKKFHHRSVMVSHSKKHMIKECILCGMNFMKECELTAHIREQHREEWPHRCNICSTTFTDSSKVKKHMRLHTHAKPYQCNICSKQFLHRSGLQNHHMTHSESEERPTCKICGKSYTAKISLEVHMRTHTGEKPYRCSVCGKEFIRKSGCLSHMRLHTGEKPYECNVCGKRFAYSSGIRSHMKIHNKTECSLCGVKLIGGIDPNKHVTSKINIIGAKCFICDIEFKKVSLFKHHLYKHKVSEREEQCLKNAENLGLELKEEKDVEIESHEENSFHGTNVRVFVEDEDMLHKKHDLPEVALLEAFPNQDGLTLSTDLKSVVGKAYAFHTATLLDVKQEGPNLDDAELFNMAVLEVTKSDNPNHIIPSFKVMMQRHGKQNLENDVHTSVSQDFDESDSQDMDFETHVAVSPLQDIDEMNSSMSPGELSNPLSPSSKIGSESEIITINATGEKEFSTVTSGLPSTRKIITISSTSSNKTNVSEEASDSLEVKTTELKTEHDLSLEISPVKTVNASTTSPRKSPIKIVKCSKTKNKPVFRVRAAAGKRPGVRVKHIKRNPQQKNIPFPPEFPQAPKMFAEEDVDLANSYSTYVKQMLTLIKPAEKQLALIKALNSTMDNFIDKYKSWK